ncbi:MAG: amidohydrolase family protein [Actinomycetota bacterium]|nr:amidohydrolase family protein [Rubrobacteraceae bacterium]MDQ3182635.1 amidohydrolase family protein [Actinomycetota bacterium]MDQ3498407.1 amidohydrolase family protein [Actinomycetota bacterium]
MHPPRALPSRALCACTANAAPILGAEDVGRLAPGYTADMLLLDAPDWRHVAYHLSEYRFAMRIESERVL